mmetsp:Transcript_72066/g.114849  ORF Transcript_72066/g.114849 Transcript_72066/m.114849 type:complete len:204 (-) Transcript_72066:158-769(-)
MIPRKIPQLSSDFDRHTTATIRQHRISVTQRQNGERNHCSTNQQNHRGIIVQPFIVILARRRQRSMSYITLHSTIFNLSHCDPRSNRRNLLKSNTNLNIQLLHKLLVLVDEYVWNSPLVVYRQTDGFLHFDFINLWRLCDKVVFDQALGDIECPGNGVVDEHLVLANLLQTHSCDQQTHDQHHRTLSIVPAIRSCTNSRAMIA